MKDLEKIVVEFREARNWGQFHNPKDLAISLNLEAAEFLELFQWKSNEEAIGEKKAEMEDELADVFTYVLLLAHELDIDLAKAVKNKIEKNKAKYPIDKAYGSNKKYTEL